jgi:hypothetical protein
MLEELELETMALETATELDLGALLTLELTEEELMGLGFEPPPPPHADMTRLNTISGTRLILRIHYSHVYILNFCCNLIRS